MTVGANAYKTDLEIYRPWLAWGFFSTQTEPKPFFISDNMGSLLFAC